MFRWKSYLITLKEVRSGRGSCAGARRIAWSVTESDTLNTSRPTGHKPCKYARYVAKSWNVLARSVEKIEARGQGERDRKRQSVGAREARERRRVREREGKKERRTEIEVPAKKRASPRGATKLNGGKKPAENKTRRRDTVIVRDAADDIPV